MYRNYDGNKSTFGDTSVAATAPNPDTRVGLRRAALGRRRADGDGDQQGARRRARRRRSTSPTSPTRGVAQAWQLTAANAITRLADVTISGTSFVATLPAQSVTLFVIPADSAGPSAPTGLKIKSG